jgi:AraC family transcriptional regulator, transcriptional activator of pobA
MASTEPYRLHTIGELHRLFGLPRPAHPLISVVDLETIQRPREERPKSLVFDFYCIALKRHCHGKFRYGQQHYDFEEGIMYFMAPGQVFGPAAGENPGRSSMSGWGLYLHPDFLWNTALARNMKRYDYFDYSVHEALLLTEKEESTILGVLQNIQSEYLANQDNFSQDIIISHLEVLLNYADRFYHRQFLTRKKENHQILDRLEGVLTAYFNDEDLLTHGWPSVKYVAGELNLSPNYLSSLLKALTGRNTQQHIQDKMIDKAKEKISTTELSVSEISYALGFEHPQSFSRLFKARTGLSPLAFRQSFN